MKYTGFFVATLTIFSIISCQHGNDKDTGIALLPVISNQLDLLQQNIEPFKHNAVFMPRTFDQGKLELIDTHDWCSGFYPGTLWYMYGMTKDEKWKKRADYYTERLDTVKNYTVTHDLGFIVECSYGTALKFKKSQGYEDVILQSAKSLIKRFNPNVGAIKSWDWSDKWEYPVIIDNMMNLELLFHASRISGDSIFYKTAVSHADVTLKNHFRYDNSSYHVVDYDPNTGEVTQRNTHQGLNDESAWARGQAWGLYGFTMCYRETKNPKYLELAVKIASFLKNHPKLPKDRIPYWDFDVTVEVGTPKDASAAAITASALYELRYFVGKDLAKEYLLWANEIMQTLSSPEYLATEGKNGGFLLKHSTGHLPGESEIDVPLNYADYYFLEALVKKTAEQPSEPIAKSKSRYLD